MLQTTFIVVRMCSHVRSFYWSYTDILILFLLHCLFSVCFTNIFIVIIIRCTVIESLPPGTTKTFSCNGMEGRFINIVIPGKKESLTLCEVEVTGKESSYKPENNCNWMRNTHHSDAYVLFWNFIWKQMHAYLCFT